MNETEAAWQALCAWEGAETPAGVFRVWTLGCGFGYCEQPFLTLYETGEDCVSIREAGGTDGDPGTDGTLAAIIRRALAHWDEKHGVGGDGAK